MAIYEIRHRKQIGHLFTTSPTGSGDPVAGRMKRRLTEDGVLIPSFSERVLEIALAIPKGKVMTYGGIARSAGGGAMASQSITGILGRAHGKGVKNIPFHRIVYADGKVWIDERHRKERMEKYKKEGIVIDERGRIINFEERRLSTR